MVWERDNEVLGCSEWVDRAIKQELSGVLLVVELQEVSEVTRKGEIMDIYGP
jgi:hypothetical protein